MATEKQYTITEIHSEIGTTEVWATSKADALRKLEKARGRADAYVWWFSVGGQIGPLIVELERYKSTGKPVTRTAVEEKEANHE